MNYVHGPITRFRRGLVWIFGFLSLIAVAGDTNAQEQKAVVTQVQRTVTDSAAREIRTLDILPAGSKLHVPRGGRIGLICSSDHWVDLVGVSNWVLNEDSCRAGRELEPGTYRSLAPRGGRFRTVDGVLVIERDTRDLPTEVVLLSPRETLVREARPKLRWFRQPGAVEYEIELTGSAGSVLLRIEDEACAPEVGWEGAEVCSVTWPSAHPGLNFGDWCRVNVGYRTRRAAALTRDDPTGLGRRVERLGQAREIVLSRRLEAREDLWLSEAGRALYEAGLFVEFRLYADAITSYRRARSLGSSAVTVTLGDLYFETGLPGLAAEHYSLALKDQDSAIQAASRFGLGRVWFIYHEFDKASDFFHSAEELLENLGLLSEQKAAGQMVAECEKRSNP